MSLKERLKHNRENLGFSCLIHSYPKDDCDDCPYHYHCLKEERKRVAELEKALAKKDEKVKELIESLEKQCEECDRGT